MEYNLGKVLLTPKGDYNGSTAYEKLDVVTYNGSSYVAKQSTTGNAPTDGQTNTYWQLLAKSSEGGGSSTNVRINGVSITNNDIANILTEGAYDETSNKIATMSEIPMELLVLDEDEDEGTLTQEQIALAQSDHCIIVFYNEYYYKNYLDGSDLEYILNYIDTTDNGICQKVISINTSEGSYSIEEHSLDIQSDWNESDSTSVAYIKNKPTIPIIPVQDVTVGGTSVVSNGTAVIPQEVFWATYGTTTAAEIDAAVAAGKLVACYYNKQFYILSKSGDNEAYYYFGNILGSSFAWLRLQVSNNSWVAGIQGGEVSSNKVSTISGYETDTTKYPNTKAVADALGKLGVISQTITWSGLNYTLSSIVTGLIPQELISQATYWGATFNSTTGYFEYGGFDDIAADEIREAILTRVSIAANAAYRGWGTDKRIFLPFSSINAIITEMFMGCNKVRELPESIGHSVLSIGNNFFNGCSSLRYINLPIYGSSSGLSNSSTFNGCKSLMSVKINNLNTNLNLSSCSALLVSSIANIIESRSIVTTAHTITLHADALARCTADTTEYEYNSNTYTGIVALATAKNITLAS